MNFKPGDIVKQKEFPDGSVLYDSVKDSQFKVIKRHTGNPRYLIVDELKNGYEWCFHESMIVPVRKYKNL